MVTFILEIKHLARQSGPCSQFYPQKLWEKMLPKKCAIGDYSSRSTTCTSSRGLAHNIVHRICAEGPTMSTLGSDPQVDISMRYFYAWQENAYESSTLVLKHRLAHNLINRLCAEVHTGQNAKRCRCAFFVLENNSLTDQRLSI
jgi:hypothetical protein